MTLTLLVLVSLLLKITLLYCLGLILYRATPDHYDRNIIILISIQLTLSTLHSLGFPSHPFLSLFNAITRLSLQILWTQICILMHQGYSNPPRWFHLIYLAFCSCALIASLTDWWAEWLTTLNIMAFLLSVYSGRLAYFQFSNIQDVLRRQKIALYRELDRMKRHELINRGRYLILNQVPALMLGCYYAVQSNENWFGVVEVGWGWSVVYLHYSLDGEQKRDYSFESEDMMYNVI